MITDIDRLIRFETSRAIKAILESSLSQDGESERHQQKRQQDAISARDLYASDNVSKKDEAESEDDDEDKDQKKEKSEKKPEPTVSRQEDRTKGRGTADSPKIKDPEAKQLANPSVASVIDKLNGMRGGRSLKDPEVKKSFTQYYEGLTVPEKQSLIVFLTGIAQILAGSQTGAEAIDPGDVGLRVKDSADKNTRDKQDKPDKNASKEGTSDNPIVVGEVASKHRILCALKEYSKNT